RRAAAAPSARAPTAAAHLPADLRAAGHHADPLVHHPLPRTDRPRARRCVTGSWPDCRCTIPRSYQGESNGRGQNARSWTMKHRVPARAARTLVVSLGALLVLGALPNRADAHAVLTSSRPGTGERLGTAPGAVVLEFSEPLNA